MTEAVRRIVLDTNVLVAAAYAPGSASRRIVDACLDGQMAAVASPATIREYRWVLSRSVRPEDYKRRLDQLLEAMQVAEPAQTPRHVPDDSEDDKFLAAAVAGGASWIVTNDRHLLDLDPYWQIRIVRPGVFVERAGTQQ
jgi:putative PIN family toxin of toxin-antitoxin system